MLTRTPLAWKNLVADWRRLGLSCAGVAFAAVLMFMQTGFRNALLDSPVQILHMLRCDLVAISTARYAVSSEERFPADLLLRASADRDVAATAQLGIERVMAQVRIVGQPSRPIRVLGIPLEPGWFRDPQLIQSLELLKLPHAALLDSKSRPEYGFHRSSEAALIAQTVELVDRTVQIVGTVDIGTDFANEGTLVVSQWELGRYFPMRGDGTPRSVVDLGMLQLRPGANPAAVAQRLTQLAPRTWEVLPRQQLIQREIRFWSRQTPIGMIFLVGAMMGFAVGVIICYQILFTSIHDAMPELATLKAMGYPNRYFVGLVVRQSVYLSLLGFVPALLISFGLFQLLESLAGLPMLITVPRALLILGLTIGMCLCSGLLALRRLIAADPASLF